MTLQQKLYSESDTLYVDVVTDQVGASYYDVTGLDPSTHYSFRYVAVGDTVNTNGTAASVTTLSALANDNFGDAIIIGGDAGALTDSNYGATAEIDEPEHYTSAQASIWYKWTAPANGTIVFTTAGSNFDTTLAAYTGTSLTALTLITNNDDSGGSTSRISFEADLGISYYIVVDGYLGNSGTVNLSWSPPLPPVAPSAPTFDDVLFDSLTVIPPALPIRANYMRLQQKLDAEPDTAYSTIDNYVIDESNYVFTLDDSTTYRFRFIAVGTDGETVGTSASVTTAGPPLPAAPEAPSVSGVGRTSLKVTTPSLPQYADSMSLQRATLAEHGPVTIPTTNLRLWLKADSIIGGTNGTPLSFWGDVSGQSNHARQSISGSRPIYFENGVGGRPTLRFDGNQDFLSLPAGMSDFSAGLSAFVVTKPASAGNWARFFDFSNGAGDNNIFFTRRSDSNDLHYGGWYAWNGGPGPVATDGLSTSGYQAFSVVHQAGTPGVETDASLYKNGELVAGPTSTIVPDNVARAYNFIGRSAWEGDALFHGDIAEIVLYNSALSEPDRETVEDYLKYKYGIGLELPTTPVWTTIATDLEGNEEYEDDTLTANTTYLYRCVAVNLSGSADGEITPVTTLPLAGTAPSAPSAPTFSLLASTSVRVTAPVLPANSFWMKLERKVASEPDSSYVSIAEPVDATDVTFAQGLLPLTEYSFRYVAVGDGLTTAGTAANVTTTSLTPIGTGTGLRANYFNNTDFSNFSFTRVDSQVKFSWGSGSPSPMVAPDTFAVRWQGEIEPLYTETYTFYADADNGVRVWIDDQLVIDHWSDALGEASGQITLDEGTKYDVKIEYYENLGTAKMNLLWSSASQAKQLVPQIQLYPTAAPTGTGTGLRGQYFDQRDFSDQRFSRIDPQINFNWGTASPGGGMGGDTFGVWWTGQIKAGYSETYTFRTETDDTARLWVDGVLVTNTWGGGSASGTIALVADQSYDIKLQYREGFGSAAAKLFWSSTSQTEELIPQAVLYPATTDSTPPVDTSITQDALFVSQTVPSSMTAGETYPVTVRFKNIGSNLWTSANNYKLGSDASPWGLTRVALPGDIAYGEEALFSFNVTAPATPGSYSFVWSMVQESVGWFGDVSPDLTISVVPPPPSWTGALLVEKVTPTSVQLKLPTLPAGATGFTLQRTTGTTEVPVLPSTSGLLTWFKADSIGGLASGSVIQTWGDSSGNGRHATQADSALRPKWIANGPGGKPTIRLDGVNDFLQFPSQTSIRTVFAVVRHATGSQDWAPLLGSEVHHFHGGYGPNLFSTEYTPAAIMEGEAFVNGVAATPATMTKPTAYQIISLVTTEATQAERISTQYGWDGRNWNGDYAEVLLYDSALSSTDREDVENYLKRKYGIGNAPDISATWTDIETELASGATYTDSGLTSNTTYWYRCVPEGLISAVPGDPVNATTTIPLPGVADAPTFSDIAVNEVTVTAPALPSNTLSLTLQKKIEADPDGAYIDVEANLEGSSVLVVSNLDAGTAYSFRYVAVGEAGTVPGISADTTTLVAPPEAPGIPVLKDITMTSLVAVLPEIPFGAESLSLQQKLAYESDESYTNIATTLGAGEEFSVTGLDMGTEYAFRAVAVGDGGSTPGLGSVIVTGDLPPDAPDLPQFSNVGAYEVTVEAPAVPGRADSLILQGKLSGKPDSFYSNIEEGIQAYSQLTQVRGLNPGMEYSFRYVAASSSSRDKTPGLSATVTTLTPSIVWASGTGIECAGIRSPKSSQILTGGATHRLNSFVAIDWDLRSTTIGSLTRSSRYSDPCTYTWAADGGSFEDSINTGKSVSWVAPTTPGTYTITLTVDDQNAANKPAGEGGSREDASKGYNDDLLKFSVTVTVP